METAAPPGTYGRGASLLGRRAPTRLRPAVACCYLTVPAVAYAAYVLASVLRMLLCTSFEVVEADVGGLCSELVRVRALLRVHSPSRVAVRLSPLVLDVSDGVSPSATIARLRLPAQTLRHGAQLWEVGALIELVDPESFGAPRRMHEVNRASL